MSRNYRGESLGIADMETPANYAVNFWQFGCKINVFHELWPWLSPATWHRTLSHSIAQFINLSSWSANRAMTPNMR